jgi:Polyketide cyclase / dehydrase and lipid transport
MRIVKLVLVTVGVLAIGTLSAQALEARRRSEVPGTPPVIWAAVGDFCAIKDWHPLIADCKQTQEGDVTFRTLTLKDGGTIKEKLTDKDDLSYSYEIVESPLPVKNYKAKLWVEPDDEPERTAVYWEAEFDANGASDDEATKKVYDILVAGMKGIKKVALEKTPGGEDHD